LSKRRRHTRSAGSGTRFPRASLHAAGAEDRSPFTLDINVSVLDFTFHSPLGAIKGQHGAQNEQQRPLAARMGGGGGGARGGGGAGGRPRLGPRGPRKNEPTSAPPPGLGQLPQGVRRGEPAGPADPQRTRRRGPSFGRCGRPVVGAAPGLHVAGAGPRAEPVQRGPRLERQPIAHGHSAGAQGCCSIAAGFGTSKLSLDWSDYFSSSEFRAVITLIAFALYLLALRLPSPSSPLHLFFLSTLAGMPTGGHLAAQRTAGRLDLCDAGPGAILVRAQQQAPREPQEA